MSDLFTAYRDIIHLTEWTGLGVGALAACGAAAYFGFAIPPVRRAAIAAGLAVLCGYAGLMHGGATERRDVFTQWDAANKKAAEEADKRDKATAASIEAKYAPVIAQLQKGNPANEREIIAAIAGGGTNCKLGDAPLRLRGAQQHK